MAVKQETIERLRNRVDVYSRVESKTEFGELTYKYEKQATVWAEVLPTSGRGSSREKEIPGDVLMERVITRITCRIGAVKDPRADMYFMYKGQMYEIMYIMEYHSLYGLISFYCKLITETEEDY